MRTVTRTATSGSLGPITAHDLRNPISGILSASQSLIEDLPGAGEENLALLQAIQSSCEAMLRLIDERIEEFRGFDLQPTDLVSLIRDQLALSVRPAERKRLKIELIIPGEVPMIHVDPTKISLMFGQLMRSAIQFARPDSRLRIQVSVKGGRIILSVRAGKAPQKPAKKNGKPGHGAETAVKGFAVITRIVEGHGGQFKLSDKLEKSSLFTVTFPLAQNSPPDS